MTDASAVASIDADRQTPLDDFHPDPELSGGLEQWNPDLAELLLRSLGRWMEMGSRELDAQIREMEKVHHEALYVELIYLLSNLRIQGEQARQCWSEIVSLRDHMCERLHSPVDLRVALASYFLQVNRKLENPKIIELKLFERTRAFAYRDDLTGLHNYRFFRESLPREMARSERTSRPLSIAMIDIDHFKEYNDRNGHEAGNRVLARVSRLLAGSVRKEDLTIRYGGEEFILVLPDTPKVEAHLLAEQARSAIETHEFPQGDRQPLGRITVSIGLATFPGDSSEPVALVRCADRALYAAKAEGRNRVQLYARSRRSFHRVRVRIEGRYRALSQELRPLAATDISEGGLLVVTDQKLPVGSLMEMHLMVPDAGEIRASGCVVHVLEKQPGRFDTAVRFVDVEPEHRRKLARYVAAMRSPGPEAMDGAAPGAD